MKVFLTLLFLITASLSALTLRGENLEPVSDEDLQRITPALIVSGSAACGVRSVRAFDCGPYCDYLKDQKAEILYTAGDGQEDPYAYLMYLELDESLVVAHSPTNFSSFKSVLIDADFIATPLATELVDGLLGYETNDIHVHSGFHKSVMKTFVDLKSNLTEAMDNLDGKIKTVRFEGHSMGAASAAIEALALYDTITEKGLDVKLTTFGSPKVGNDAFADLMDKVVEDKLRITNKNDKVPHEPKIGYKHYSGEVYIPLEGETNEIPLPAGYCEGQEDKKCAERHGLFDRSDDPHEGPYFGKKLGRSICTNEDAYPPK